MLSDVEKCLLQTYIGAFHRDPIPTCTCNTCVHNSDFWHNTCTLSQRMQHGICLYIETQNRWDYDPPPRRNSYMVSLIIYIAIAIVIDCLTKI